MKSYGGNDGCKFLQCVESKQKLTCPWVNPGLRDTQMYESLQLTSKAQTEPLCFYKYISRHIALFSSHQVNGGFPLIWHKELTDTWRKDEEAFVKAFATRSSKVAAIGFQAAPKITLIHDESKHLPIAHTCANELLCFVSETTMADDDAALTTHTWKTVNVS